MLATGLRRARKLSASVAVVSNMIGTGVIFSLVAIMNIDVISRGLFNAPFRGVIEVVIFSLILIVFLQLPDVVRNNRLTRSDGMLLLLREHRPGLARSASRLIDAVSAGFMFLIAWTIWPEFLDAFESCHFFSAPEFAPPPTGSWLADLALAHDRCDYFGTPGIFTAPWWPAKLAIFFGVALCGIIFGLKAVAGEDENGPDHISVSK